MAIPRITRCSAVRDRGETPLQVPLWAEPAPDTIASQRGETCLGGAAVPLVEGGVKVVRPWGTPP